MDTLFSGVSDNFGGAIARLFTLNGAVFWLMLLVPMALVAVPLLAIRPAGGQKAARVGRAVLAALPAAWVAIYVIATAFGYNEKLSRFSLAEAVFWVSAGLTAVTMMAGVAAIVMVPGWHRLTAVLLTVINLWLAIGCAFVGVIVVSGVTP